MLDKRVEPDSSNGAPRREAIILAGPIPSIWWSGQSISPCPLTHQPVFLPNPDAGTTECMHARPLPTHPQFSITHWPGFTEYRVEHWRLARDGSGRFLHREVGWSRDVVVLVGAVLVVWVRVARSCVVEWADVAFVGQGRGETCPAPCPHRCGDCTGIPPLDPLHPSPPRCALSRLPFPHAPLTHPQNPSSSSPPSGSNSKPTAAAPSSPSTPPGTLSPSRRSKTWSFTRACAGGT